jgi:hypothetical protein
MRTVARDTFPKLPVDRMLGTCADLGRARGAEQAGR